MIKAFQHFLCRVFGHKWTKQSDIEMKAGLRGQGQMIWEECSRCGDTRFRWIADVNLSKISDTIIDIIAPKISPEMAEQIDDEVWDEENAQEAPKPQKARAKRKLAEAA